MPATHARSIARHGGPAVLICANMRRHQITPWRSPRKRSGRLSIAPTLVEPSGSSYALNANGRRSEVKKIKVRKLDKIETTAARGITIFF